MNTKSNAAEALEPWPTNVEPNSPLDRVMKAIACLYDPEHVVELCAIAPGIKKSSLWGNEFAGGKKAIVAGWFRDKHALAKLAVRLDAEAKPEGVYVTLNPVAPALLGRADHRLKAGVGRTQDREALCLRNLLVDVDTARPSGISSSEPEKAAARDVAHQIAAHLTHLGWPEPLFADSGNGWHLVYKIDLANTSENVMLVKGVLMALAARFDTDEATVDQSVFNPARLVKLWGTMARKGDHTVERPHRLSALVDVPEQSAPVPRELLEALAAQAGADATPRHALPAATAADTGGRFDVRAYLERHGRGLKEEKPFQGGTLYVLEECVFDPGHAPGEAAIYQAAEGRLSYKCFHDSCRGRTWKEARQRISGDAPLGAGNVAVTPAPASQQPEEWTPLLLPWPTLSPKAHPGIAGAFIELATRESEADPAAVLATFLTRFGVEVSGNGVLKGPGMYLGETRHYPRLFTAIVGASSKARKGTSAHPVNALFSPEGLPDNQDNPFPSPAATSSGPLSTGEGLAFCVRDARTEWVIDKKTSAGSWVLVDPGVEDKRLYVADEEFASALQCTKREGNTLSTAVRCFWDSGDYSPMVKKERTKVTGAHVGIVTHITFQELRALLDEVQAFNGFGNRFLWVCAKRHGMVPIPRRMPQDELSRLRREVSWLVDIGQRRDEMTWDGPAEDLWRAVYPSLSREHSGLAGCIINRGEAQTVRLSMIYALLDGQGHIGEAHLQAGLAFWDYCRASALNIFGSREANSLSEKIRGALAGGPMTTTALHRALGNNASRERLCEALQELLTAGRINRTEEKTTGRPKVVFTLNEQTENNEISPKGSLPDNS